MTTASETAAKYAVAITLPDGSVRRFDHSVSGADIAADIGPGLAKAAIALFIVLVYATRNKTSIS